MREFETGATRDVDDGKFDFEGFLSHSVLQEYAAYMHTNRVQADGALRASDNWQKGIPQDAYMKSGFRHFMDWWNLHRTQENPEYLIESACALLFNVMGYIHEELKKRDAQEAPIPQTHADYFDSPVIEGYRLERNSALRLAVSVFAIRVLRKQLPLNHPLYRCQSTNNLMFCYPDAPEHRQYVTEGRLIDEGLLPGAIS